MNNTETAEHILSWCDKAENNGLDPFSWPTDGCGYEQHIRFVHHRNAHWDEVQSPRQFLRFCRTYAERLTGENDA